MERGASESEDEVIGGGESKVIFDVLYRISSKNSAQNK